MHTFQEWVPKQVEARLAVVGTDMFAAAIHAGSDAAEVDWRTDYDALTYTLVDVRGDVRAAVLSWMSRWQLSFGAFDFAVRPDGHWVFFECNPAGQWAWIEVKPGHPSPPRSLGDSPGAAMTATSNDRRAETRHRELIRHLANIGHLPDPAWCNVFSHVSSRGLTVSPSLVGTCTLVQSLVVTSSPGSPS